MGAGVSQKDMNRYYYRRCKKIQRELAKVGIVAEYRMYSLFFGEEAEGFSIGFRTIRASNGETAGLIGIGVYHNGRLEKFDWLTHAKGIERIKTLFGRKP